MQFKSILSTSALIASAFAAPTPSDPLSGLTSAAGSVIGSITSTVTALDPTAFQAYGTISCTESSDVCTVACGESLQSICTLVGAFDSVFYALELFAGFQIQCTEKGCKVECPTDGTVVCALDNAGAVFDSIFVVGEGIVIDGVEEILASLTGGDISSQLIPANAVESAVPGISSIFSSL